MAQIIDTHKKFFKIPESGIWNVGTGKTMSFAEVAHLAADEFSAKIEAIPMPKGLKGYQKYTCADMTKLNRTLK